MQLINDKAELEHMLGTALTDGRTNHLRTYNKFGRFVCEIEDHGDVQTLRRDFANFDTDIAIPFTSNSPTLHMMFSLDGRSFFNNRKHPLRMESNSHSLSFLSKYECLNILEARARQHDIAFRVSQKFCQDILLPFANERGGGIYEKILCGREFNTINNHRPNDPAISGLLKNILECPFTGEMKAAHQREHLRALLMLQLFHFSPLLTGDEVRMESRISKCDEHVLHEVKAYLDEHYLHPCSLDGLSKRFGLNEFKLKHGFKRLFDVSPIRYMQQKRLQFSLVLLRDSNKTVKEIADMIGYGHAANYTAAFTRMFTRPPHAFRGKRSHHLVG